jgi:hypothetical protein
VAATEDLDDLSPYSADTPGGAGNKNRCVDRHGFLTPLSLTLLLIALLPPRPHLRRLVFQPAVIVGVSALFVLIVNTALLLTIMSLVGSPLATFTGGKVLYFCRLLAEQTGIAVGVTWFIQAVGGRSRRPQSWVDISGLVLGACWIILALASATFTLL